MQRGLPVRKMVSNTRLQLTSFLLVESLLVASVMEASRRVGLLLSTMLSHGPRILGAPKGKGADPLKPRRVGPLTFRRPERDSAEEAIIVPKW